MGKKLWIWSFGLLVLGALPSSAQVKLSGTFTAAQECAAVQSLKKKTNAGNVSVKAGESYALLGKNKADATHYWIEVPNAQPAQRWVAIGCGTTDNASAAANKTKPVNVSAPFYVLALSWQPAFCESKREKTECKIEKPTDYQATNFALHGLWPQPRRQVFCGVDKATIALDDQRLWDKLPEVALSPSTQQGLDRVMPGTQSLLERHEWIKHGTCYPGGTAESYYKDSVRLTEAVNQSVVQDFVSENIGKTITTQELRAKFDEAFGMGAGERVRVACDKQGRIAEITIGLKGDIPAGANMAALIAASDPTDAGCPQGFVDPVN